MNKFQPFSFNNIEDFRSYLPDDELRITDYLRSLATDAFLM
jgi:hypothetical protein